MIPTVDRKSWTTLENGVDRISVARVVGACSVSYDKNPPARERVFPDKVAPPVPLVLVWPSIAWAVTR